MFLKVSQNLQENTWVGVFKKEPLTKGAFSVNFQNY